MIPLKLDDIDRAIYNHLRLGLVVSGCLPNISIQTSNAEYQTARNLIKSKEKETGIPLIDIYGVGTGESREATDTNKIVLDRNALASGSIGGNYTSQMKKVENKWEKRRNSDSSMDISYEIRTLSKKTSYDRIMTELITAILGTSRYIPVFSDYEQTTDRMFYLSYEGSANVSATIDTIERMHRFIVRDVFIAQPTILEGTGSLGDPIIRRNIVPLTSIHFKTHLYWEDPEPEEIKIYKEKEEN